MNSAFWYSLILTNLNWLIVVLSAAAGQQWIGLLAVAVGLFIHVKLVPHLRKEAVFIGITVILGLLLDGGLGLAGAISYPSSPNSWWSQPFMIALWVNFALMFPLALNWLRNRYPLAFVFGAIGGTGAYYSGARLGAVATGSEPQSFILICIGWTITVPLLLFFREQRLNKQLGCSS